MERILGERKEGEEEEVLVKWKGYSRTTWEPKAIIEEGDAIDLLQEFRKQWNNKNPDNRFNSSREECNED